MKMSAAPSTGATSQTQLDNIKPATRLERVLTHLVLQGSINCLDVDTKDLVYTAPFFEHALNSTMSNEIKQRLELTFSSIPEKTLGYDGLGAIYHLYSLTDESSEKAKLIINYYRTKRGAKPIQWETAA